MIDLPHNYSGVGSGPGVNKIYVILKRTTDGYVRDVVNGTWEAPIQANSDNYDIILTEHSTTKNYYFTVPDNIVLDGAILVIIYTQFGSSPSLNVDRYEGSNTIQSTNQLWDYLTSSALSAIKTFRLIEAGLFGVTRSFNGSPGNREFFNISRNKRRFVANIDVNGNRLTITHDDLS